MFCSVIPNTTGGSAASANKAYFQSARTSCQSGQARSASKLPQLSDSKTLIREERKGKKITQEEEKIVGRSMRLHAKEENIIQGDETGTELVHMIRKRPQASAINASHQNFHQLAAPGQSPFASPTCTAATQSFPLLYVYPSQTVQTCLMFSTAGSSPLYILTSYEDQIGQNNLNLLNPSGGGFYISAANFTQMSIPNFNFQLAVQSAQPGKPGSFLHSSKPYAMPISSPSVYFYITVTPTDYLCLSFSESDCTPPSDPQIVDSFSLPVVVVQSSVGQGANSKTLISLSILPSSNGSTVSFSTSSSNALSCSNATSSGSLFFYDDSASQLTGSKLTVYAMACKNGLTSNVVSRSWNIFPSPYVSVSLKVDALTSTSFSDTLLEYMKTAISQVVGCNKLQVLSLSVTTETSNTTNYTSAYLSLKILTDSNVDVVQYNKSVVSNIMTISSKFKTLANVNATTSIRATSITSKLSYSNEFKPCTTHYDCTSGLFCATQQSSTGYICQPCATCVIDSRDSYNGVCPQDLCPNSGGYPRCVDASAFLAPLESTCSDHHAFSIWKYGTQAEGSPQVIPSFTPKVRELTPYNRLVGAVVITQTRMKRGSCLDNMKGADVRLFTSSAGSGINCPLANQLDSEPFGYDPTFMTFSSIYNGKLRPEVFYGNGERYNSSTSGGTGYGYPKGFYPQKYDQNALDTNMDGMLSPQEVTSGATTSFFTKASKYIDSGEQDTFKLYFDERLTYKQALKMVQFAQDGKFIDSQTKEIKVEIVTYNAVKDIFMYSNFVFAWQAGGKIPWDYSINTISVDKILSPSHVQIILMVIIVVFLIFNCAYEFRDILIQARKFALHDYLADPFNWIDLAHFFFMWGSVFSWFMYRQSTLTFKLSPNYPILFYGPEYSAVNSTRRSIPFEAPISASNFAKARMFRTNNAAEYDFLQLINAMRVISSRMELYSFFSGVAVVLFVMRMLKSLDFQERMGMVTRTIARAASDLWHFVLLFFIVFVGYAIVGVLLFGHQFEGMHDLSHSCITLTIFLLSLDATQFYSSMSHAATPLAFYIFLWSYIFIVFFILFNIFLAILVDAYATVKQATDGSTGLLEELAGVIWHAVRRVLPFGSRFLSDEHFQRILKDEKTKLGQGQRIQSEINRKLEDKKEILLRGGVRVDLNNLQRIVQPGKVRGNYQVSPTEAENDAKGAAEASAEAFADDMVLDVMDRYGSNVLEHRERRNHEFKELVGIENMRRLLVMNLLQINVLDEQKRIADVLESMAVKTFGSVPEHKRSLLNPSARVVSRLGELHVTVVSATGLPRMDLIRSCDPYCVLYIDGHGDQQTHITETVPKSQTPHWNEKFVWDLYTDTRIVTISLWDRDNVTKDDLIGTVLVDLRDLEPNSFGKQLDLNLTNARKAKKLRNAKLQVIFQRRRDGETMDSIQEESAGEAGGSMNGSRKQQGEGPPDSINGNVEGKVEGKVEAANGKSGDEEVDSALREDIDKMTEELEDSLNLSD